jgi:16S rRNA (cytosine967-C5)-methyltransferase
MNSFRSASRRPSARPERRPDARSLALCALQANQQRGVYVSQVLDDLFTQTPLLPRDRHLATELAAETLRRSLTLTTILKSYVSRPPETVDPEVWLLLQLGCCQLICLSQIPAHAAVNETVAMCERIGKDRARGFVNGILRTLQRELRISEEPAQDWTLSQLSRHSLPLLEIRRPDQSHRRIEFARPVFASPSASPLEYVSQVTSLPAWLVQRWADQQFTPERLLQTGLWMTNPGRISLRVNLNQTTRPALLDILSQAQIAAVPGHLPESIVLSGSMTPGDVPVFHDGWFSVQDESAMEVVDLLHPLAGESILDLCAAPGGKTCHIAERLQGTGKVVACDLSAARLQSVTENAVRLGLPQVQTLAIGPQGQGVPEELFDAVLIDAPCSNTGVLGKRPEARWRISPETFAELTSVQVGLLDLAWKQTRPGGRVVYSTCSIDREENLDLVNRWLVRQPDAQLQTVAEAVPGQPADGGFRALIRKSE